jgi:hypothetical protein
VSHDETKLSARDYYLLGLLAERTANRDRLLSRYTDDEVARLVQAGYLKWETFRSPNGAKFQSYSITPKGQAAWQAYRFTRS